MSIHTVERNRTYGSRTQVTKTEKGEKIMKRKPKRAQSWNIFAKNLK
jgi:hypothetical protein